jgi:crotonobetainyl-CoA:carnitine CoA-transferase CaiB-like acyl-CoA transferase
MAGPLNGVKILGFTHYAQAPFALQLLGDFGADIINVERPGTGDFNRGQYTDEAVNGEGLFFLAMNRNKRSLALDLKKPEAAEIVRALVKQSNVLVTNFRPGVLDKLGFGFDDVKKLNPAIIYAEAAGYGSTGPYAKLPGQDLMAQCMSGYASIVGKDGAPQTGGTFLADMYSAVLLAGGICAALYNQRGGGEGQKLEVNLLNSALHLQTQELTHYMNTGKLPQRPRNFSSQAQSWAPYGIYPTKDGYICISIVAQEKIPALGEALGIPDLEKHMQNTQMMFDDRDEIFMLISAKTAGYDTADILGRLRENGVWCEKVNNYDDVMRDPQVIHNKIIQEVEHPVAGRIKLVACPITMSGTPARIRKVPPLLGEDSESVLTELGYTPMQIREFFKEGIIA